MKIAVMDIGSNSVRLLMTSDGKTLYKTLCSTRLGEGSACGRLNEQAMSRTAAAIVEFYRRAEREGAQKIYAFATAAVRSAANGQNFTAQVKALCGLDIEILSGEEEARIGILGALGLRDGGIIDIGGASSELIVQSGGQKVYCRSIYVGAVRLHDACGNDRAKLENTVRERVKEYGEIPKIDFTLTAIGGTATSIAALALGLREYDAEKVQNFVLSRKTLSTIIDDVFSCSPEELTKKSCLPLKRAEIVGGGACMLFAVMDYLSKDSVIVSDRDNLEGYLTQKGEI